MNQACILGDMCQPGPTVSRGMLDVLLLQALQRRHLVWHSQALLAVSSLFWWWLSPTKTRLVHWSCAQDCTAVRVSCQGPSCYAGVRRSSRGAVC